MNTCTPDSWVVIKFVQGLQVTHKVLAGWHGGYVGGDSWKLNSGIARVVLDEQFLLFYGYSGSVYRCHTSAYGTSACTAGVYAGFQLQQAAAADQDSFDMLICAANTDFIGIEYQV